MSTSATETWKKVVDFLLDKIEDAVQNSDSPWDDTLVVPAIKQLRDSLEIPDTDS